MINVLTDSDVNICLPLACRIIFLLVCCVSCFISNTAVAGRADPRCILNVQAVAVRLLSLSDDF